MNTHIHTHTHTLALYNTYVTRLMVLLTVFCALSVFLYGIFLLMAVSHTASRTALERQITQTSKHLGDVEMNYLTEQKTLTPELATSLGFVARGEVSTVLAQPSNTNLTINVLR